MVYTYIMGLFVNNINSWTYPPFNYRKDYMGGTERLAKYVVENILPKMTNIKKYNAFICPGFLPAEKSFMEMKKPIIMWMHTTVQEFEKYQLKNFRIGEFGEKVDRFITVSEFHKQNLIENGNIDPEKITVINNGINKLYFNENNFKNVKKVKIINTSSEDRFLDVALRSLKYIEEDFIFEFYNGFYPDKYLSLDKELTNTLNDPRTFFYGRTPKKTIIKKLQESHIYGYPLIGLETFCLSQVEAMSAGLLPIYNSKTALPEISNNFGIPYFAPENDIEEHAKIFAKNLSDGIKLIKSGEYDPSEQIEFINNSYSWEAIEKKWLDFDKTL
jgi:glycosyltransferase involved in cell wall biosynthesis